MRITVRHNLLFEILCYFLKEIYYFDKTWISISKCVKDKHSHCVVPIRMNYLFFTHLNLTSYVINKANFSNSVAISNKYSFYKSCWNLFYMITMIEFKRSEILTNFYKYIRKWIILVLIKNVQNCNLMKHTLSIVINIHIVINVYSKEDY